MPLRASLISSSILSAIFHDPHPPNYPLLTRLLAFLRLFHLLLTRHHPADFAALRTHAWSLDEHEYTESFRRATTRRNKGQLIPIGDLGYSGSAFFTTPNGKYLIKSLPRRFEYRFFTEELLDPYVAHMHAHPTSLLVRITDLLFAPMASIGGLLGAAPTHHIVMENVMYGRDEDPEKARWETYDLKPSTYFVPERDIAGGRLASEGVKERLVDEFPDRIVVSPTAREELLGLLELDTGFLEEYNAVDYSLFLVRYPGPNAEGIGEREVKCLTSRSSAWRDGMVDVRGEWVYRAVVLDFFWAKHALRAQAMSGLVKSFNFFARKGEMSITTRPDEYRERFLNMVQDIVAVPEI
ncbi:SAICAR synthase-like protein [Eremomyces bilateralis CBS 781.70]|uniref:SAICAR synthase-like protein n=1 Tax=Eremomyces bilateralis CBS 781.70 TaxID=1392243 RepID=A0A6G1FSQ8_9PEZI|nr:SAICAR synthase-like protein [Eremomyces bilateralis CBS 781.70]KAF1808760.1 SAICAR synthase-like protein [Eremomyces bilateralis CBS 781.70]